MDTTVDIPDSEAEADIETTPQDTPEAPPSDEQATQPPGTKDQKPYNPFSNGGKEKFKVDGKEFEWDWETTKRYAQLGRSGQSALERAAQIQKSAKATQMKLIQAAQNDPEGLIRILTGNPTWTFNGRSAARPQQGAGDQADEEIDPREAKIQELENRLKRFEESDEKRSIDEERKVIERELEDACKKYPNLNDEITRHYVKAQYRQALINGVEVTLDDVAFHISQQLEEKKLQRVQDQKQRIEQKRNKAPVTTAPGGGGAAKKPMTFDEIRKMAGLA